jgi:hypothetical protein
MIQKLSQAEYAKKVGATQPAISYRLKRGLNLPGIIEIEKFSRFYLLHFDTQVDIKEAKKMFK